MLKSPAADWITQEWFNTETPLTLSALRGQVVVVCVFQMLCPSCVTRAIPQARRISELFRDEDLAVIGLHSVFESNEAMSPASLQVFLQQFHVTFPVGVDQPAEPPARLPRTMRAYDMQGTPTTLLIDAEGKLRRQVFGAYDDLALGRDIGRLLAENERTVMP